MRRKESSYRADRKTYGHNTARATPSFFRSPIYQTFVRAPITIEPKGSNHDSPLSYGPPN